MRDGLIAGRICIDEFVQKPIVRKTQYEKTRRKFPYLEGPESLPNRWIKDVRNSGPKF